MNKRLIPIVLVIALVIGVSWFLGVGLTGDAVVDLNNFMTDNSIFDCNTTNHPSVITGEINVTYSDNQGLILDDLNNLTIQNCIINLLGNALTGIKSIGGENITIINTTINDIGGGGTGIEVISSTNINITQTNFIGLTTNIKGDATAQYNFWNTTDNETIASLIDGDIDYDPWLLERWPTDRFSNTDDDGDGFNLIEDCNDTNAVLMPIDAGTVINSSTIVCNNEYNLDSGIVVTGKDYVVDCNYSKISGNAGTGMAFFNATNITLQNCLISGFDNGIMFNNSNWNVLINVSITKSNDQYGIFFVNDSYYNFVGESKINSEIPFYYVNRKDLAFFGHTKDEPLVTNLGQITLINTTNASVINNDLIFGDYGLFLIQSNDTVVKNNSIEENNILNAYSDLIVNATLNWWGSNEEGELNATLVNLTYDPWLFYYEETDKYYPSNQDEDGDSFSWAQGDCDDFNENATPENCNNITIIQNLTQITLDEDNTTTVDLSSYFFSGLDIEYIVENTNEKIDIIINGDELKVIPNPDYNGESEINLTLNNTLEFKKIENVTVTVNPTYDDPGPIYINMDLVSFLEPDTYKEIRLFDKVILGAFDDFSFEVANGTNTTTEIQDQDLLLLTLDSSFIGTDAFNLTLIRTFESNTTNITKEIQIESIAADAITTPTKLNVENAAINVYSNRTVINDYAELYCEGSYNSEERDQTCLISYNDGNDVTDLGNHRCDPIRYADGTYYEELSSCGEISRTGKYYISEDIFSKGGSCLSIYNLQNSVIDCQRHYINSEKNSAYLRGVRNTKIRNCDFAKNIEFNPSSQDNIFYQNNFHETFSLNIMNEYCYNGIGNYYTNQLNPDNQCEPVLEPFTWVVKFNATGMQKQNINITCNATDGSVVSKARTIEAVIDHPPEYIFNKNVIEFNENSSFKLNMSKMFKDPDNDVLNYSILTNNFISFSHNKTTNIGTIKPKLNFYHGQTEITLKAKDENYEITKKIIVTVKDTIPTCGNTKEKAPYSGACEQIEKDSKSTYYCPEDCKSTGGGGGSITPKPPPPLEIKPPEPQPEPEPEPTPEPEPESEPEEQKPTKVDTEYEYENPYSGKQGKSSATNDDVARILTNVIEKGKIVSSITTNYNGAQTDLTLSITNGKLAKAYDVRVEQEIPKTILSNASRITSETSFEIIKEDPLIAFIINEIGPGQKTEIKYTIQGIISQADANRIITTITDRALTTNELEQEVQKTVEKEKATREVTELDKYYKQEDGRTKVTLTIDPSKVLYNVTIYEEIPKCLAQKINEIIKTNHEFTIIDADPLISWHFDKIDHPIDLNYEVNKIILNLEDCEDEAATMLLAEKISDELLETDTSRKIKSILPILIIPLIGIILIFFNKYGEKTKKKTKINESLLNWIKKQEKLGKTRLMIAKKLHAAGWTTNHITDAFKTEKLPLITRLIKKLEIGVEEFVLIVLIILNIFDFLELLPGDLDYVKKIISWAILGYLLYKASMSNILFGKKSKNIDFMIVFAYFMFLFKDFVEMARFSLQEANLLSIFYRTILKNYALYESTMFVAGALLLLIIAIYVAIKFEIKYPSLLAIVHEEGRPPTKLTDAMVRFTTVYVALVAFFIVVFNLMMEWLTIAVDAPLLVLAIFIYIFILMKHHKKFSVESFLYKIGNTGESFYRRFLEFFHYKKTILFAITGMLILHLLTDVGNFIIPHILGIHDEIYFNNFSIETHRPVFGILASIYGILGRQLESATSIFALNIQALGIKDTILVFFTYVLNTIGVLMMFLMPALLWYSIFKKKVFEPKKIMISLFFACFTAMSLRPVYQLEVLRKSNLIGVSVTTHTAAYGNLALVLLACLFVGIITYFIQLKYKRILIAFAVVASTAFFSIYVYYFFKSMMYYYSRAINILIVTDQYFKAFYLLMFMTILILFYLGGFGAYIYELSTRRFFYSHLDEDKLEMAKKHRELRLHYRHRKHHSSGKQFERELRNELHISGKPLTKRKDAKQKIVKFKEINPELPKQNTEMNKRFQLEKQQIETIRTAKLKRAEDRQTIQEKYREIKEKLDREIKEQLEMKYKKERGKFK